MKTYPEIQNDITNWLKNVSLIDHAKLTSIIEDLVARTEFDVANKSSSYKGIAKTTTNPGTIIEKVFYIAETSGSFAFFKDAANQPLVVGNGFAILSYTGVAWEKTEYTIDLSSYARLTDLDKLKYFPFADGVIMNQEHHDVFKDVVIYGANPDKTYYLYNFTYHHNASNYLTLEIKEVESDVTVAVFSQSAWAASASLQVINLAETSSSGITAKILLDTAKLSSGIYFVLGAAYTLLSQKTYSLVREIDLNNYPRKNGSLQNDFDIVDGEFRSYDAGGLVRKIPSGKDFCDNANFSGNDVSVDVVNAAFKATDIFILTVKDAVPEQLSYSIADARLTVYRASGDTSGLEFTWLRIKTV